MGTSSEGTWVQHLRYMGTSLRVHGVHLWGYIGTFVRLDGGTSASVQ